MYKSLWPHGLQHVMFLCLSPTPGAFSNSCPLSQWCHPTSVMPSNRFILCCPLLLLPSIFPSSRVFSNKSVLRIRWPKHWSFSFSISPSNEYSRLIFFRIDWFDLLYSNIKLKVKKQNKTVRMWLRSFPALRSWNQSLTGGWRKHGLACLVQIHSAVWP